MLAVLALCLAYFVNADGEIQTSADNSDVAAESGQDKNVETVQG